MTIDAKKGGSLPPECVRFGRETDRVIDNLPCSSLSLSPESSLSCIEVVDCCGASMLGGADGLAEVSSGLQNTRKL